jgi:hypothetical protein
MIKGMGSSASCYRVCLKHIERYSKTKKQYARPNDFESLKQQGMESILES